MQNMKNENAQDYELELLAELIFNSFQSFLSTKANDSEIEKICNAYLSLEHYQKLFSNSTIAPTLLKAKIESRYQDPNYSEKYFSENFDY